jgi:hypothetical protein
MDKDRDGVIGLANGFEADMDLWIGGHRPCIPFSPLETCASIGAVVRSQALPLDQAGGVNMIDSDQHIASGVPLVSLLLHKHLEAVQRGLSQVMTRESRRAWMSGRVGDRLTTEIIGRGKVVKWKIV